MFLGDPKFKPYVTGDPDYISVPLNGGEDFLVVASDGLWDCVNDDEIASNVYHQIATNPGKSKSYLKVRFVINEMNFKLICLIHWHKDLKMLMKLDLWSCLKYGYGGYGIIRFSVNFEEKIVYDWMSSVLK